MAWKSLCFSAFGLLGMLPACSDPVPPPSRAAAAIHIAGPISGTGRCTPDAHFATVPHNPAGLARVTESTIGDRSVDGEGGALVKCSVKPSGDKFVVEANLSVPALDPKGMPLNNTIMTLSTTVGPEESGAAASFLLQDDHTESSFTSSKCKVSVKKNAPTDGLEIAPGKIWAAVTCTELKDQKDPESGCDLDSGYIVLENCDQ
ncbi:MAG TPA: hypothetical protein VJT73_05860 [Polyangiaceae bacterium]|nr:hypothetical protein [Polyangiaceae bacterium]